MHRSRGCRRRVAEEQRSRSEDRSEDLQRCFDKLGDFDDDRWSR